MPIDDGESGAGRGFAPFADLEANPPPMARTPPTLSKVKRTCETEVERAYQRSVDQVCRFNAVDAEHRGILRDVLFRRLAQRIGRRLTFLMAFIMG